jgi:hypothetical protein
MIRLSLLHQGRYIFIFLYAYLSKPRILFSQSTFGSSDPRALGSSISSPRAGMGRLSLLHQGRYIFIYQFFCKHTWASRGFYYIEHIPLHRCQKAPAGCLFSIRADTYSFINCFVIIPGQAKDYIFIKHIPLLGCQGAQAGCLFSTRADTYSFYVSIPGQAKDSIFIEHIPLLRCQGGTGQLPLLNQGRYILIYHFCLYAYLGELRILFS